MGTIVEEEFYRVIATDITVVTERMYLCSDGFCSQAILNDKSLVVPHPEADIRFNYVSCVQVFKVGCGFPLFVKDYTVIGTLCCMGFQTRELTPPEFTMLKKIAEVVSKIIQCHGVEQQH
jgi:hypothetical protein|uniref:GAF domain-containing protein n=1 Tax=Globisporangium ultimum (strain ATCC 200006 / CBS 805.95 / DAOM BR144) TaxID=431595 RepID=K3WX34_GLOUD